MPIAIAEIGINHHGDIDTARKMILAAKSAGADIAKFQRYDPRKILGVDNPFFEEAKACQFSRAQHEELSLFCQEIGIEYCCSVFHPEDVSFFEDIGMRRYKIASRSANDRLLLERIAETRKAVIMSTGLCSAADIRAAKDILGGMLTHLLHCVCKYPANLSDIDIGDMLDLEQYAVQIGFSSHCPLPAPTLLAVADGASCIENHVKLENDAAGCDSSSSMGFDAYAGMIGIIRDMEKLGC